ncbi:MAG TPA: LysM peptidoglycan-binding domain-containing protein [Oculatellaceae cyanobacterium]
MSGPSDTNDSARGHESAASKGAHHDAESLSRQMQAHLREQQLLHSHHAHHGHHEHGHHHHKKVLHGHVEASAPHLHDVQIQGADAHGAQDHVVKKGENLSRIAKEIIGKGATQGEIARAVKQIVKENHIKNPDLILPNQVLHIPDLQIHPGDATQKPGDATQKPGDATQKPGDATQKPGDATQKPGDATQKPGDATQKPGDATQRPGDATQKPGDATQKPGDATQKPGDATQKPGDATQKPGDATQKPGDATQKPGDATQKPGDATQKPGDATQKPGDATQKPGDATAQPKPEVSHMSQQQLEKAAQDIHDAAFHRNLGGYGWGSPEADPIKTVLGTMTQADRDALKQVYETKFKTKMQDDINAKFNDDPVANSEINALMMRKDGKSDEAGTIHTALAKLGVDGGSGSYDSNSDSARDEGEIRNALASMTSKQIAELRDTYQKNYGTSLDDALKADPNLSDDSKHAIGIYLKGIDNRTSQDTADLAQTGLSSHRLDMFQEAMQYATPADRQAFMNNGGQDKINQAFSGGDAQVASDYAKQGYVGLNTIVKGDTHWYHTNKEDIGRAVDSAQPDEKAQFQLGKKIADSGQPPQNDSERQAVDFYQQTEKAFHSAGNEREAQIWTAKLNGSESVVTNILQTQHDGFIGIGKGHDKNALYGAVENLSPQDWQSLKQNPDHLKDVDKALQAISDDGERNRLMQMLRDKLGANTYEDSQNIGRRPVTEALQDAGTDTNLQANALVHMTPAEREAYRTNADGFADNLNSTVKQDMKTDGASLVAQDVLAQIKAGQEPKLSAVDKVAIASDSTDNALRTATDIEAAFQADPSLLARIKNPQNPQDQQLQKVFQGALNNAVDKAGLGEQSLGEGGDIPSQYPDFAKTLLETGHLPVDQKMQLVGDNKEQMLNVLQMATPDEKAALLNQNPDAKSKQLQDAVLGDGPQRALFQNVLQQGKMTDADQFRAYSLGYGGDSSALLQRLDQMTPQAKQDLANEYYTKYGSLISEDVVGKAKPSERFRFVEELQPTDQNVRQIALDARAENDRHTSAFDGVMRDYWDYSGVAAQDNAQKLNSFVAQHAAEIDNLPPEQRKQFTDAVNAYMQAQQSYIDSKGAAAEAVVDAAITVAAIGGAAFTGGTSLALLGAIGVGGAAFRVGAMRALEGSDFDGSAKGIAEQAFKGGTAAMMGFVGPEMFGVKGVLAVGEGVAARTATGVLERAAEAGIEQSAYRGGTEAAQQIIKDGVAALTRREAIAGGEATEAAIKQIAEKALGEGATDAQRKALEEVIAKEVKSQVTSTIREKLINEGESAFMNIATASGTNVATEIASTAVGLSDPKTLMERMEGAAVSGAAGAAMFHFAFRAASAGYHGLTAAIGRDGQGLFAGGGTTVRHADGTETVVKTGDKYRFKDGDQVVEQAKNDDATGRPDKTPKNGDDPTVRKDTTPKNGDDPTVRKDTAPKNGDDPTVRADKTPKNGDDVTVRTEETPKQRQERERQEQERQNQWRHEESPTRFSRNWTDAEGRNWHRNSYMDHTWRADDGATFSRDGNKESWEYADGRRRVKYSSGEDYSYDPKDGWKDKDGNKILQLSDRMITTRPDNSSVESLKNGTKLSISADRKHVEISSGRRVTEVEYSEKPGTVQSQLEVSKVKMPDGRTLERVDAHSFRDANTGKIVDGNITVDGDGNVITDNGLVETKVSPEGRVERHNSPEVFQLKGNVKPSQDFINRIDRAYLDLPPEVRQLLKNKGYKMVVGDTVGDVDPSLKGVHPRGHRPDGKWDYVEGYNDPTNKLNVVTEHYEQGDGSGKILTTNRAEGVMRHEVGHGVDDALGNFSAKKEFLDPYNEDKAAIEKNLSAAEKAQLEYFLQAGNAGPSEAFAELFGVLHGGGCAQWKEELIKKAFPKTTAAIEKRLAELKATGN